VEDNDLTKEDYITTQSVSTEDTDVTKEDYIFRSKVWPPRTLFVEVWKVVPTDPGPVPRSYKQWYVEYRNGIKYEGYISWTGAKKIYTVAPVKLQFLFRGIIRLAKI
ncbi:hypothetical protein, partial [Facklamia sp. P12932]|uniref:hypothetical protein n=1 Tax=Facklamia sp. P12932 TaxID=3421947 RepID=UPI003D16C8FB